MPQKQDFVATARGPMKPAKHKGSNHALEGGFCCHRPGSHETRQAQRQQPRLRSKNLLPLPEVPLNPPNTKAATTPQKQEFAATARGPMKLTKSKGSNRASEARFCCPSRNLVIMTKKHEVRTQISNKMNDISRRCIYNKFVRGTCVPPAYKADVRFGS